jgi:excisionase family DNA binding protein
MRAVVSSSPNMKSVALSKEQLRSLPRLLSVEGVALELQVSTKTVRRWIGAGLLAHHRLGRQIRIAEHDVRAFLAGSRRDTA